MASPLVSVLIPTFKRVNYVAKAIESVQTNGWHNYEIIVSDDYADGKVAEALEELKDERIRYLIHRLPEDHHEKDLVANWQHAALAARGEYIFKLDDDDLILPGFLEKCLDFLSRHPNASSVYTAHECFEQDADAGRIVMDYDFFGQFNNCVPGARYIRAVFTNQGGYPRNHKTIAFYRREAAVKLNFYHYAREDFAFSAALGLMGDVGYIPESLYRWRSHPENAVKGFYQTWQSSQRALKAVRNLPFSGQETMSCSEWQILIQKCQDKLPLFYFLSALRDGSRSEALAFRRALGNDQEILSQSQKGMRLLLILHFFGGRFTINWLFWLYLKGAKWISKSQ